MIWRLSNPSLHLPRADGSSLWSRGIIFILISFVSQEMVPTLHSSPTCGLVTPPRLDFFQSVCMPLLNPKRPPLQMYGIRIMVIGLRISGETSKKRKFSNGPLSHTSFLLLYWHKPLTHGFWNLIIVGYSQQTPSVAFSLQFSLLTHRTFSKEFGRSIALKESNLLFGRLPIHASTLWSCPWNCLSLSWCSLCQKDLETHSHLFSICPFVSKLWSEVFEVSQWAPVPSNDTLSWLKSLFINYPFEADKEYLWIRALSQLFCGRFWEERNARIFHENDKSS